ncbi:class I SAM-dependent methyltransferase [Streptacidiphilus sp. PB12-B1b]|uniref:class I SAM-dependent DNA methyltransferase n=1 Tax=Streptacidiphilus sp. PB12-B1b TaxID=2705012 RepID=UPI0015F97714|nr:class I SAM-dependent methyltransferase [Streptacidiphilus sp. PB12-B1b]QMU78213.1 class I SAM-dependent methyltransferase [Streptacidiphilus sp. PB12-B1b]
MSTTAPLAPYDALSAVYDRWTAENDYARWAAHLADRFRAHGRVRRVLDVCCGTGSITALLQQQGLEVVGVDGSAGMLEQARSRTAVGTELIEARLPGAIAAADATFDAAVCCFDSVNYFRPEHLAELFGCVARLVRPGGLFVFDVNTRHKLESLLGNSHYGDDLGDFAYVWRNRYHPEEQRCDFSISLFTRSEEGFARQPEHHSQWWFSAEEIRSAARAAGFEVAAVTDDYREQAPGPETLRETWTLVRAPAPSG